MPKNPPNVNGVMELTEEQSAEIRTKLEAIQDSFVATDDQPICDIFYTVSTYNRENVGSEINGDTASHVLGSGDDAVSD